ncbi:hypothetical protein A3I27_02610 [Candidatus Giovannonibacteria bacterium RIFCSPLOWO2_02_FULL_43_11b]|uniref:Glycosyltransferase 2-like domain-containing protein n=1 Tax=Candidatus Giovannonibacteria bacterium RIFCSPHIGHO2_12_FULL_43_15 TaxID=1798341 RepID=A0A1F5WQ34_9BACT|nr:MAG: hypothetical protein A2739_03370 [Candidatus Giovannonibacteria bacterium RIFCSPHIGHO2_01_FULL_43_100]OGF66302.1 MAG: hypothetical protein A3B97_01865 [Candidatus Giovannonibacteria bacterium RIFCSPHIGHO2_02_FULL_43_32]OGF77371.1 MAG: hypothetical protein A3F23_00285 [Candidatus Giovannonibacteria bacterium RIFCSPHIGHO2_12_FULL_43_15]OGF79195.1 MAG: hypothetical protein A3A15_01050 [Candidatus Giovannonibacteria bacterium RIFCSPLOWO2_01_FULL_43_60]OGF90532.1 MAG: hypothetical protein A3
MENEKLISVGMPVYNSLRNDESFLRRSLESILTQTYKNLEVIISDNASQDKTGDILKKYALIDSRIKYFRQENNVGAVKNFSFVINEAKGEYFMLASDDDFWERDFIKKLSEVLDANSSYSVAMSHYYSFSKTDLNDKELRTHDYTHMSYIENYRKTILGKTNPIFMYGLYRTLYFKKLYARLMPNCREETVILMCESALATRWYSYPEPLYWRYRNPLPNAVRHAGDPAIENYSTKYTYTKYFLTLLFWPLSSRVIPFSRKFLIFGPWFERAWYAKRKIFNEILGTFSFFYK